MLFSYGYPHQIKIFRVVLYFNAHSDLKLFERCDDADFNSLKQTNIVVTD